MAVQRMMVYLDTHLVLWLYAGDVDLISDKAVQAIEEHDVAISPIVELELQYLYESKRIKKETRNIISTLRKDINLKVCGKDFSNIIQAALPLRWTRDPFDRLIVAHASLNENILLTKDRDIAQHYAKAVW